MNGLDFHYAFQMGKMLGKRSSQSLDHVQIAARLSMIGNGAALSYWNGTIDVNLLEPGLTLSSRRVLASGNQIDAALFERANARLAELEGMRAIRKGPLGWVNTPWTPAPDGSDDEDLNQ